MAVDIKFETERGFEEHPTPYVLVKDLRTGVEKYFPIFGSGIHIEILKNGIKGKNIEFCGRTDYMLDLMNNALGDDMFFFATLDSVKSNLVKMLEYVDYKLPYYDFLEIVR